MSNPIDTRVHPLPKPTRPSVAISIAETAVKVIDWATARNIIGGATALGQYPKLSSEWGEALLGLATSDSNELVDGIGDTLVVATIIAAQVGSNVCSAHSVSRLTRHPLESIDSVSTRITLMVLDLGDKIAKGHHEAVLNSIGHIVEDLSKFAEEESGKTLAECFAMSYDEIKDRRGVMHNGIFVKSTDPRYEAILAELGLSND